MAGVKKPKVKKQYISHQEFIGNPSMQGGKTARAKAEYEKAKKGGAAKTAAKLVPVKTKQVLITKGINMGQRKNVVTDNMIPERKVVKSNIINDKAKTATRAMIIEMNAIKKLKKKGK